MCGGRAGAGGSVAKIPVPGNDGVITVGGVLKCDRNGCAAGGDIALKSRLCWDDLDVVRLFQGCGTATWPEGCEGDGKGVHGVVGNKWISLIPQRPGNGTPGIGNCPHGLVHKLHLKGYSAPNRRVCHCECRQRGLGYGHGDNPRCLAAGRGIDLHLDCVIAWCLIQVPDLGSDAGVAVAKIPGHLAGRRCLGSKRHQAACTNAAVGGEGREGVCPDVDEGGFDKGVFAAIAIGYNVAYVVSAYVEVAVQRRKLGGVSPVTEGPGMGNPVCRNRLESNRQRSAAGHGLAGREFRIGCQHCHHGGLQHAVRTAVLVGYLQRHRVAPGFGVGVDRVLALAGLTIAEIPVPLRDTSTSRHRHIGEGHRCVGAYLGLAHGKIDNRVRIHCDVRRLNHCVALPLGINRNEHDLVGARVGVENCWVRKGRTADSRVPFIGHGIDRQVLKSDYQR